MKQIGLATSLLVLMVGSAEVARADVAPPDDYVETCTRARQEADDEFCEYRSASFADPDGCCDDTSTNLTEEQLQACCDELQSQGWTNRCRTWGGSFYRSLWCRSRQQGDPARPEVEDDGAGGEGCGVVGSPSGGAAFALALLPAFAVFVWWGRRRFRDSR